MLKVDRIRTEIKGFAILREITLVVPTEALIGLAGRNGAGKTTTLKSIMGLLPVSRGKIYLDERDLLRLPAYQRARLGVGYLPEDRRLIGSLTAEENILLPAWTSRLDSLQGRLAAVYQMMPDVALLAKHRASTLSGGQQKMVALARALMTGTKLLLLDEPFEGLAPAIGMRLERIIPKLKYLSRSVLVTESDPKRLSFADKIYVMERGEIIQES